MRHFALRGARTYSRNHFAFSQKDALACMRERLPIVVQISLPSKRNPKTCTFGFSSFVAMQTPCRLLEDVAAAMAGRRAHRLFVCTIAFHNEFGRREKRNDYLLDQRSPLKGLGKMNDTAASVSPSP